MKRGATSQWPLFIPKTIGFTVLPEPASHHDVT